MKFTMNVDCTPEEARTFFGLPDVQPMQEAIMKELQERMQANIRAMDPQSMMQQWFPLGMQNLEQFQKIFWGQMGQGTPVTGTDRKKG
jgi:hypothetical protein